MESELGGIYLHHMPLGRIDDIAPTPHEYRLQALRWSQVSGVYNLPAHPSNPPIPPFLGPPPIHPVLPQLPGYTILNHVRLFGRTLVQ